MKSIRVRYFAIFREQAGRAEESVEVEAATAGELYAVLAARRGLSTLEGAKVAVNDELSDWSQPLEDGDTVLFFPPVAGG